MFERFTDDARRVVVLAQEQCRLLGTPHIGTEHLLLGLLAEEHLVSARALQAVGVTLPEATERIRAAVAGSSGPVAGHIPFTPNAKKALELSLREVLQLGSRDISPGHILLGLVRLGEGLGVQTLLDMGVDLDQLRGVVLELLETDVAPEGEARTRRARGWRRGVRRPHAVVGEVFDPGGTTPIHSPLCPHCREPLELTARSRFLELPTPDREGARLFLVAFCGACGHTLSVTPDDAAPST